MSETMNLGKGVGARINSDGESASVWLWTEGGRPQQILLIGVQDKLEFEELLRKYDAGKEYSLDAVGYSITREQLNSFLAELAELIDRMMPN